MWTNSSSARKLEDDFWSSVNQTPRKLRYTVNRGVSDTNGRKKPNNFQIRNRSVLLEPKIQTMRDSMKSLGQGLSH